MQPYAVVATKRDAGPVLNVLLFFDIVTLVLGGTCLGIGVKIGGSFTSVSSVATSFWWGGLVLLILGVFYIPCHVLVKQGNSAGRGLFVVWTFLIGLGVLVILISTGITAYVWTLVRDVSPNNCVYTQDVSFPKSLQCSAACVSGLTNKFGYVPSRTCCCCDDSSDIIYAKGVDSCDLFKNALDLARPLAILYIVSLIIVFIDMVMGYVVACGCCDVQTPWFTQPMVTTTNVVMTGSSHVQQVPGAQPAYAPPYEPAKQPYA